MYAKGIEFSTKGLLLLWHFRRRQRLFGGSHGCEREFSRTERQAYLLGQAPD